VTPSEAMQPKKYVLKRFNIAEIEFGQPAAKPQAKSLKHGQKPPRPPLKRRQVRIPREHGSNSLRALLRPCGNLTGKISRDFSSRRIPRVTFQNASAYGPDATDQLPPAYQRSKRKEDRSCLSYTQLPTNCTMITTPFVTKKPTTN